MIFCIIFSTTGGWGKEATRFRKQLANLIAQKSGESYNTAVYSPQNDSRIIEGTRGLKGTFIQRVWKITDLDLNIVDHSDSDRLLFNI